MIKPLLVEMRVFTDSVKELLEDERYRMFQAELCNNPMTGEVIPGCGGLRKARIVNPAREKGKRGGLRAIYLNVPEADRIILVALYSKDQKDDLTENEKKMLRTLAAQLKQEARQSIYRKREYRS